METSCETCLATFPELKDIASQFKCGICYEVMKTPMMTSCSHTYCSYCIRTWISTKQVCPTCPSEVRDDSLRNNLALDNCIAPYIALQSRLHELCKAGIYKNPKLNPVPSKVVKRPQLDSREPDRILLADLKHPVEIKEPRHLPPTSEHNNKPILKTDCELQNTKSPIKIPAVFFSSPKTNSQPLKTDTFTCPTPSSSSREQSDVASSLSPQSSSVKVPCPVCCVEIPERNINIHLDKCLSVQKNGPSPKKQETLRREPLKKLVYHMMSEKDIRKKLKDFSLSTKGDRSQLVNRLQRYIVLYNSECDSLNPRPVADIRRQIEKEEEALSKVAPTTTKIFRVPKNANANEIEELNKQYIDENKSSFNELIRQVRERQKKETGGTKVTEEDSTNTTTKRYRVSDDESDEFCKTAKRNTKSLKSRRLQDSDDEEMFLSRKSENTQRTASFVKKLNTIGKDGNVKGNHNISASSNSTTDDIELSFEGASDASRMRTSVSPVLSRMCPDDTKATTKGRHRKQRTHTAVSQAKISPVEVRRSTRQRKGREKRQKAESEAMRTVSRTPSLSPTRLQSLEENSRGFSESEEEVVVSRSESESDLEMDCGNDNLSQLVGLLDESGASDCSEDC